MPLLAVALLVTSAVLHATWNFLGKRQHPTAAFMLAANLFGVAALAPVALVYRESGASFSADVWRLLVLTGLCQAVYYVALAGAYRAGDLSLTYPLVRATPVLLVALLAAILGQGEPPSRQALAGMAMIVAGCLTLPLRAFSELHPRNFVSLATALALVAALGTVGYSILDDRALRLLRSGEGLTAGGVQATLVYAALGGLSATLWGAVFIALRRSERQNVARMNRFDLRQAAVVGVFILVGYLLVLISLALVANVGYAVAFRQLSIPLGAMLGVLVLREPAYAPRLLGIGLVFAGLVLVATG